MGARERVGAREREREGERDRETEIDTETERYREKEREKREASIFHASGLEVFGRRDISLHIWIVMSGALCSTVSLGSNVTVCVLMRCFSTSSFPAFSLHFHMCCCSTIVARLVTSQQTQGLSSLYPCNLF